MFISFLLRFFEKSFKPDLDRNGAIKMALGGLTEVIDPGNQNIEIAVVEKDSQGRRIVSILTEEQVAEALNLPATTAAAPDASMH